MYPRRVRVVVWQSDGLVPRERSVLGRQATQPSPFQGEGFDADLSLEGRGRRVRPPGEGDGVVVGRAGPARAVGVWTTEISTLTQPSPCQGEGFASDLSLEGRGRRVPTPGEGDGVVVGRTGFARTIVVWTMEISTLTQPSPFQGEGFASDLSLEGRGRRVPTPGEGGGVAVGRAGFARSGPYFPGKARRCRAGTMSDSNPHFICVHPCLSAAPLKGRSDTVRSGG